MANRRVVGPMEPLWPDGAPGALGSEPADVPTIRWMLPRESVATGATVVVCPGGGYVCHADHEAEPVGRWLNTLGVAALILRYRLGPRYRHPAMLKDACRAVRVARWRAADFSLDPSRVGILGFSAGGHLAASAGILHEEGGLAGGDDVERLDGRPDLMVLVYPVIDTVGPHAHAGCRVMLAGPDATEEQAAALAVHRRVRQGAPPAFLVHTDGDTGVPAEHSLLFATALRAVGTPVEMHLYEPGEHGYGLAPGDPVLSDWPRQCAIWLRRHGFAR